MLERLLHLKLHFYMIFFDSKVLEIELSQTERKSKSSRIWPSTIFIKNSLPWAKFLSEKKQSNYLIITPVNYFKKGTIGLFWKIQKYLFVNGKMKLFIIV